MCELQNVHKNRWIEMYLVWDLLILIQISLWVHILNRTTEKDLNSPASLHLKTSSLTLLITIQGQGVNACSSFRTRWFKSCRLEEQLALVLASFYPHTSCRPTLNSSLLFQFTPLISLLRCSPTRPSLLITFPFAVFQRAAEITL